MQNAKCKMQNCGRDYGKKKANGRIEEKSQTVGKKTLKFW